jgi:hypothetical protein
MYIQQEHSAPMARVMDKTTLLLRRDRVLFLDDFAIQIRRRSGAVVPRSAIIRALIEALFVTKLNFPRVESEDNLAQAVARCLLNGSVVTKPVVRRSSLVAGAPRNVIRAR